MKTIDEDMGFTLKRYRKCMSDGDFIVQGHYT